MTVFLRLLFLVLLGSAAASAVRADTHTNENNSYLSEVLLQSRYQTLSAHPVWHRLLLYKPAGAGSVASLADDPLFFLAPDGKTNPGAELEADLTAFLTGGAGKPFSALEDPQSAHCRFPARYAWLKSTLALDTRRYSERRCETLQTALDEQQPVRLILVFPVAHPDQLASLFGHSLLRFENDANLSPLLQTSVNFAAQLPAHVNFIRYVGGGIGGGFHGEFTFTPYAEKLHWYNEVEGRDIWEYTLRLTQDQVRFIFLHVWELQHIRFHYYFLSENCSYHLLSLLEPAVPGAELTRGFDVWTLPLDVIKTLRRNGLIDKAHYLPSLKTRIDTARRQMPSELEQALTYIPQQGLSFNPDRMAGLTLAQQVYLLDWLADVGYYQRLKNGTQAGSLEKTLLRRRSDLPVASSAGALPVPRWRPDQGHDSMRFLLGTHRGRITDRPEPEYYTLQWRAGYHDWMDDRRGHDADAQVKVLDTTLRIDSRRVQIEQLDVFHLSVLHHLEKSMRRLSWQAQLAYITQSRDEEGRLDALGMMRGGLGVGHIGSGGVWTFYLLGNAVAEFGPALSRHYAVGPEVEAGLLIRAGSQLTTRMMCRNRWRLLGEEGTEKQCIVEQNVGLNRRYFARAYYQIDQSGLDGAQYGIKMGFYY